jgi:hypothetical protein
MNKEILDLYGDYLLCGGWQTTTTGLSQLTEGKISHDKITRFLSGELQDSKSLWLCVKKLVREYQNEEACLIFDDTIIEKAYSDENEIVTWNWDNKEGRTVKGINLLTAFYSTMSTDTKTEETKKLEIPVAYEIISETEKYVDKKTNKEKRRSVKTKNDLMIEMISTQINNRLKFRYVLADTWFSSTDDMKFINGKKKIFIFESKENRLAALSKEDRNAGRFTRIDLIEGLDKEGSAAWLNGSDIPVMLYKQVFKNKDGSQGTRYLVTNDRAMSMEQITTLYERRWSVEVYHKSIKQNASLGSSPAHTERKQSNHIFSALYAYVKLEKIRIVKKICHFALKMLIYSKSLKSVFNIFSKNCFSS